MFDISKTANAFLPSQIPAKSLWLKIPFMFLLATILITGCDSNSAIDDSPKISGSSILFILLCSNTILGVKSSKGIFRGSPRASCSNNSRCFPCHTGSY